jgi:hypothetical protein
MGQLAQFDTRAAYGQLLTRSERRNLLLDLVAAAHGS